MAQGIQEVGDQNFDAEVIASDIPVLVDFSAVWCGPCKALEPAVKEVANEFAGKLKVVKVDIDVSPSVAARFGIRGVPTVIVVKGGREVKRQVGLVPKPKLVALFKDEL
jgi:thioredoxin 1